MRKEELRLNQEVVLIERYNRYEEGPRRGVITRIGRSLVDITVLNSDGEPSKWKSYRIEDQTINDGWGHNHFMTHEQYEQAQKIKQAVGTLHEHGLERRPGKRLPDDKLLALAEFLQTYDEEHGDDDEA